MSMTLRASNRCCHLLQRSQQSDSVDVVVNVSDANESLCSHLENAESIDVG